MSKKSKNKQPKEKETIDIIKVLIKNISLVYSASSIYFMFFVMLMTQNYQHPY